MVVLSADTTPPHRGMSRELIEDRYRPSGRIPSLQRYTDEFAERGAAERAALGHLRLEYGTNPDEWMWYCPAPGPDAPLQVFVHGGFWRRLSADDGTLFSAHFRAHGAASASLNYSLCPSQPLSELVRQTIAGLDWLVAHAAELGHDPTRIHVIGHSAGAHLIAMALTAGRCQVAGATFVSGIFDLTPILLTTVNDDIHLDDDTARRLSPLLHIGLVPIPTIVAVAELDTEEFKRQTLQWASTWADVPGNLPPVALELIDRNHFDMIYDVGDASTALGRTVLRQMRLDR